MGRPEEEIRQALTQTHSGQNQFQKEEQKSTVEGEKKYCQFIAAEIKKARKGRERQGVHIQQKPSSHVRIQNHP